MSFAKPFLASMERRVAAFAIDAFVLFLVLAISIAVAESVQARKLAVAAFMLIFYTAYQAISVANPSMGLGRTVAAIRVVSVRRSGEVSRSQAIGRAIARTLWLALGLAIAKLVLQSWVILLPLLIDLALISLTPWRQSVADLLAGTIVVNTPPLQPHRAPAGPMFSKHDAEFGRPPRTGA